MFEQVIPAQVWQRAKQRPTQFNSNKNKPGVDYKEVAWVPPVEHAGYDPTEKELQDRDEPKTA